MRVNNSIIKSIVRLTSVVLLMVTGIENVWADATCTLSNANIVAGTTAATGYGSKSATDGCGNTWNAYAVKNYHSNATSSYHYLQIKAYGSNTAYYIQVPTMPGVIKSISMVVSGTSAPRGDGGNDYKLYFSASNNSSTAESGAAANPATAVSGEGSSSVTLNCEDLGLKGGYITADGAVRIWGDIVVTYIDGDAITLDKNNSDVSGSTSGSGTIAANATSLTSGFTAPTRTGYTVEGYYTNPACTTKVATNLGALQPSITVDATTWTNGSSQWKKGGAATFYTKWSPKNYTVTLNDNSGSGGSGSKTVTFNANTNMTSAVAIPTKTHYIFGGYWTSANSGATLDTKVIDSDGTWVASVTGYTDATPNWIKADNVTLYAKWTEHTYKNYRTVCCTELDDINGAITWNDPTEAEVTWDIVDHVSSWTLKYRVHGAGSWETAFTSKKASDSEITEYDSDDDSEDDRNKASISSLTPCADYDFLIIANPASGYCDKDETIEDDQEHSYSVTFHLTGISKESGNTYVCGSADYTATFEVSSVAYELPDDVTLTIGGNSATKGTDYTWSESAGVATLTIEDDKQTGDIDVTIVGNAVSCSATPTLGAASLSGTFNLGTIGVSCASITPGSYCAVESGDYGFIWYEGTGDKEIGDDGVTKVAVTSGDYSSGSFAANLTKSSFATGTTYTFRAFATNTGDNTGYSDAVSFTPRSVTFNSNGGTEVSTVYVNSGGTVSAPSSPTKTGYTFSKWQLSSSDYSFSSAVSSNITLDAVWTANNYTVTLSANEGTGDDQEVSATFGSAMPLKTTADGTPAISVPTKTGYNFGGYYDTDASTGGTQYYSYTSSTLASAHNWDVANSTTTLYARWTPKSCSVTFDKNSGTDGDNGTTATYDAAMTTITAPTREGHTFGGYYDAETSNNGSGTKYYKADGTSAKNWDKDTESSTTLYANWSINSYTLTWALNGGTVSVAGTGAAVNATGSPSSSVEYGAAITRPTVTKTGYTFDSWSSTPSSTMPAANTTYTASWTINDYNIAVTANSHVTITATPASGDAIAEGSNADVNYNKTITLNYSSLASGYTWGGWRVYKSDDASTTVTVSGSGNGATFSLPAYDVKVEAIVYGAGIAWCDPDIDVDGDVYLTSYKDIPVYATSGASNLISISSSDFGSATRLEVAYLDADDSDNEVDKAESVFRLCNNGSVNYNLIDGLDLDYEWGTTHSVKYTPNAYDQRDNYKLQFTLKHGDKVLKTVTHNIYGRALPEEFVIASKFNGKWYALPDTMGTSQQDVYPIPIDVDNTTTPTEATYAPNIAVYKGAARYTPANNVNSIRLTGSGSNWLTTGSTSQLSLNTTAAPGSTTENKQVWYLKSTDFGAYTLKMDPSQNPGNKQLGINTTSGKMGMFAAANVNDIYLLPITGKYTAIPATISEWGEHGVVVAPTDRTAVTLAASATMNIDDGTPQAATISAVNSALGKAKRVRVTDDGSDLNIGVVANAGKQLYIHWKNSGGTEIGVSQIDIPTVVAANANVSALSDKKEVHVLPGVTLTGNGTYTIDNLYIYPSATLNITSGTLTATTLRLRNGWTRVGSKKYNVARVHIADDAALVKTTASMDLDIY